MIYLAALSSIMLLVGSYFRVRSSGGWLALQDGIAAVVSGWIAGLLLGVGARIGMWAIPFFNGSGSRFSFEGTLRVILTFSVLGIGLGLLYEFAFRRVLRERGLFYGMIVTVVLVYPLGQEGVEQLNFNPAPVALVLFTFFFIDLIFVPYALTLEFCLGRWHRFQDLRGTEVRRSPC
jgi:hypothetical protein